MKRTFGPKSMAVDNESVHEVGLLKALMSQWFEPIRYVAY